jgi:hypothetical protein
VRNGLSKNHSGTEVLAWIIHDFTGEKGKDAKRIDEHWVLANPAFSFGASQR